MRQDMPDGLRMDALILACAVSATIWHFAFVAVSWITGYGFY
jgi:hypothetical protein